MVQRVEVSTGSWQGRAESVLVFNLAISEEIENGWFVRDEQREKTKTLN